jgi:DNA-3-methyladenine glycosylase II
MARGMRAQTPTILDSEAALKAGLVALTAMDATLDRIVREGAVPSLRRRPAGLEGLVWIVVGQQLSTASAAAIWARVGAAFPEISAAVLLRASEEEFRAAGLSGPKARTIRAIATAAAEGGLDLDALADLPADDAHARLTAVKGIGPWTADVYLLFCLGHADAFPAGDLAVQEAARLAYRLETRPTRPELLARAEGWRPWRGVAAKVLWAHYRLAKRRDGVLGG